MSEGALLKELPKLVDPRKFTNLNAKLVGIVTERDLPRLADASYLHGEDFPGKQGAVMSVDLSFFADEQGRRRLAGSLSASVELECQRCLEPLRQPIEVEVNLAVVQDEEQARNLPKDIEPWIVTEDLGDLHAVLEEELLLALPVAALHQHQCIDARMMSAGDEVEAAQVVSNEEGNPFGVLANLKQQFNKTD